VGYLQEVKHISIDRLTLAVVKIQRFWRKTLRKMIFKEYRHIFEHATELSYS